MTELQTLGNRINTLISLREAGANNQTEIDALIIQLETHPEAATAREEEARSYDLL